MISSTHAEIDTWSGEAAVHTSLHIWFVGCLAVGCWLLVAFVKDKLPSVNTINLQH